MPRAFPASCLRGSYGEDQATRVTLGAIRTLEHPGSPLSCSILSRSVTLDLPGLYPETVSLRLEGLPTSLLTAHGDTLGDRFHLLNWDFYQSRHRSWEGRLGAMPPQVPLVALKYLFFSLNEQK